MSIDLKDVPFFSELSASELETAKKCLIEKTFEKGEVLHSEGSECSRVFFVKAGRVKIFRMSSSGKEQIFEILETRDTCACNPGELSWHCTSSAEAVEPSTVWFLSRENYVRMVAHNSKLMHALNELFAKRLQCFSNLIEEFTLKDTKKRLIKYLLDMIPKDKKGLQKSDTLFIQSTREEIAHRLGTARETVARHISDLKQKKLIDVKPYQIIIRDKAALEKLLQS